MRIATWNVERLRHKNELPSMIEICERMTADVLVLSETDSRLVLPYKSCFRTLTSNYEEVSYLNTENSVAIYTNYEFIRQFTTFDNRTAICVELGTPLGNMLVYGVVMGIYGNRHQSYMGDLPRILADIERLSANGEHLYVCGDYNCSFSDNYYFTKAGRTAIEESFSRNNIELLTQNQSECIDHIAISRDFIGNSAVTITEWNLDKKLSDHKGILAELA